MPSAYYGAMMIDEPLQPERQGGIYDNWAVREVDHLFGRLARYTRFVIFSKWFLAIVAVILVGVLVVYPIIRDREGNRLALISPDAVPPGVRGEAPSMARPVYEGNDKQNRPYRITGDKATQMSSDLIVIDNVEAMLETEGTFVSLTADKAEYRQNENRIELLGNVNVLHGKGYHFITPQATVDTTTMNITGNQQISGDGPMGKLLATGFEIRDNGSSIRFGGTDRVTVTIQKSRTP